MIFRFKCIRCGFLVGVSVKTLNFGIITNASMDDLNYIASLISR